HGDAAPVLRHQVLRPRDARRPQQEVLGPSDEGPDARHQARDADRADHHQAVAGEAIDRDPEGKGGPSMIAQLVAAVAILTGPSGLTNDATPVFTFTGPTGTECSVDAGAWAACADTYATGKLTDGSHIFRVRSGAEAAHRSFVVDTVAPELTLDATVDHTTA